jgi:hypothetical protein
MMAVSDDSDPNGTWYYTSINTLTNIAAPDDPLEILPHYADFAGMAVSSEAIFVTANMLSFDDDEANGSRLWIIDKGIGKGGFYENGRAAGPGTIRAAPTTRVDYSVNRENAGRLRSMYPAHIYGTRRPQVGTFPGDVRWPHEHDRRVRGCDPRGQSVDIADVPLVFRECR